MVQAHHQDAPGMGQRRGIEPQAAAQRRQPDRSCAQHVEQANEPAFPRRAEEIRSAASAEAGL
ncbi:MAG: hypothetical protein HGA82_03820 [Anaerolineales bacterium]|nr:hypothetical protein [Anaerolineales bacterium]